MVVDLYDSVRLRRLSERLTMGSRHCSGTLKDGEAELSVAQLVFKEHRFRRLGLSQCLKTVLLESRHNILLK